MPNIPLLHYFKCKNTYSAGIDGMRYRITPGKRSVPGPDGQAQEESILTVDIWPDPWTLEKTDPALRRQEVCPLTEEGRLQAQALIQQAYDAEPARWKNCPSPLDCEPWAPPADAPEEGK